MRVTFEEEPQGVRFKVTPRQKKDIFGKLIRSGIVSSKFEALVLIGTVSLIATAILSFLLFRLFQDERRVYPEAENRPRGAEYP